MKENTNRKIPTTKDVRWKQGTTRSIELLVEHFRSFIRLQGKELPIRHTPTTTMADEKDDDMTTAERTTWLRERVRETEFFPMERLYKYLEYGMM